ncbi:hypothetical protein ES705_03552 [subsurface metagenome]
MLSISVWVVTVSTFAWPWISMYVLSVVVLVTLPKVSSINVIPGLSSFAPLFCNLPVSMS